MQLANVVVAKVISINQIGESLASEENTTGAKIRTEPLKPTSLVQRLDISTTDTQIAVTYSNLLDDALSGG